MLVLCHFNIKFLRNRMSDWNNFSSSGIYRARAITYLILKEILIFASANRATLKYLHTLSYLDHVLAKFEPNHTFRNVQNYELFDKSQCPQSHFWQGVDAILQDVSVAETILNNGKRLFDIFRLLSLSDTLNQVKTCTKPRAPNMAPRGASTSMKISVSSYYNYHRPTTKTETK